ncbi:MULTISPECIES: YceD family protein [Francisella]|uniref:Large ribosomal RNA subunit accumulation protein YceD n=1 Tax=Francisella adeliensis TaxID=2007306 RepID=A0A2Z4XZI3_9GAMM|nr:MULTISPECIES: YceD family protein [Francisella]AXA34287.1 hypothetical protein CDH04_07660 [Francisella adeliensis]MBK2084930.1 DUF177 domain-containing protein [Francisella adeliensis]MBK2096239.1 DUF177 domain-containing protein [Francisella adeliensis]QIW12532.1 DUF177 domain-containing protein [Francisella adeliensis]QIW14405.1 DUF177 domain-containing protein [Francisella adeliensis]
MKNHYLINHVGYTKQKRELIGYTVIIDKPKSFCEVMENSPHSFKCNFSFFEEKNKTCIKYDISASLRLICQNTLEVFEQPFNAANTIILVEDDRLANDSQHEPFICEDANIDLRDIIKEEILLDLPLVPKKAGSTCKSSKKHSYYSDQENVTQEKKNPFEILKSLK